MRKTEIIKNIKLIIENLNAANNNIEEYTEPYKNIQEHLKEIEEIESENSFNLALDYDAISHDALRSCIRENGDIKEMETNFDNLLSELEEWASKSSEKKSEQIQEEYIDKLSNIKDNFDIDSIQCESDLENMLSEMIAQLEELLVEL